jgi:hypothetical protein
MNIKSDFLENNAPFHDEIEQTDSSDLPSLLPRSGWSNQVTYLRVLFRVKKRLDEIEKNCDSDYFRGR